MLGFFCFILFWRSRLLCFAFRSRKRSRNGLWLAKYFWETLKYEMMGIKAVGPHMKSKTSSNITLTRNYDINSIFPKVGSIHIWNSSSLSLTGVYTVGKLTGHWWDKFNTSKHNQGIRGRMTDTGSRARADQIKQKVKTRNKKETNTLSKQREIE